MPVYNQLRRNDDRRVKFDVMTNRGNATTSLYYLTQDFAVSTRPLFKHVLRFKMEPLVLEFKLSSSYICMQGSLVWLIFVYFKSYKPTWLERLMKTAHQQLVKLILWQT